VSEAEGFCECGPQDAPQVAVDAVEIWAGGEPTGVERLRFSDGSEVETDGTSAWVVEANVEVGLW
jgi:hypothetical protein